MPLFGKTEMLNERATFMPQAILTNSSRKSSWRTIVSNDRLACDREGFKFVGLATRIFRVV